MGVPKISILVHDLSSNALGRALVLGELLSGLADVKFVGTSSNGKVWAPARGTRIPIEIGPRVSGTGDLPATIEWLSQTQPGDGLLVCKPMPTSLGIALQADLDTPAIALDIDDWEHGLCQGHAPHPLARAMAQACGPMMRHRPNHASRIQKLESRVGEVQHRLVSNTFLEARFGGHLLYHVRDAEVLDPESVDTSQLRQRLALDERTWVGFVGTIRPHKGIDDLISAVHRAAGSPGLLLMGVDTQDSATAALVETAHELLGPSRLRIVPPFAMERLPEHVCLADIVAIPSKDGPATAGQIPAKLFDAMALARPVVATAVNDVPTILRDCGRVVTPGNADELASAIETLAGDAELRAHLGDAARQRLIESYSFDVGRRVMAEFLAEMFR
ncbi:MAG: glycosyltransferase [Planctomycetota bacterium]|nr:glycosyltransferase [Planctomycetota bacterium]